MLDTRRQDLTFTSSMLGAFNYLDARAAPKHCGLVTGSMLSFLYAVVSATVINHTVEVGINDHKRIVIQLPSSYM
jgi:hypothetical protein